MVTSGALVTQSVQMILHLPHLYLSHILVKAK